MNRYIINMIETLLTILIGLVKLCTILILVFGFTFWVDIIIILFDSNWAENSLSEFTCKEVLNSDNLK